MLSALLQRPINAFQAVSISALSDRIAQLRQAQIRLRLHVVSISALSDRIAQLPIPELPPSLLVVSISALSDRIAQPLAPSPDLIGTLQFQYPLFRIELLSNTALSTTAFAWKVSISALSDRIAQRDAQGRPYDLPDCFNIRSFGSNCSADLSRALI